LLVEKKGHQFNPYLNVDYLLPLQVLVLDYVNPAEVCFIFSRTDFILHEGVFLHPQNGPLSKNGTIQPAYKWIFQRENNFVSFLL
jgi:hypothetical protein